MNYPNNGYPPNQNGGRTFARKPRQPGKGDAKRNMNPKSEKSPQWMGQAACPCCQAQLRFSAWSWPARQMDNGVWLPESMTYEFQDANAPIQQPGQYPAQQAYAAAPAPAHYGPPPTHPVHPGHAPQAQPYPSHAAPPAHHAPHPSHAPPTHYAPGPVPGQQGNAQRPQHPPAGGAPAQGGTPQPPWANPMDQPPPFPGDRQ